MGGGNGRGFRAAADECKQQQRQQHGAEPIIRIIIVVVDTGNRGFGPGQQPKKQKRGDGVISIRPSIHTKWEGRTGGKQARRAPWENHTATWMLDLRSEI